MIGIIYKFTILTSGIFYVGQHFGLDDFDTYPGSGSDWGEYLSSLKKKFPTCWKRLVKREILWQGECNQKILNKLEEIYIRRERAHYSEGLGGCNILRGSANEYNPAKNIITRNKMSQRKKELFSSERGILARKRMSQNHANVKGKNNPCFGTIWITNGEESKRIFLHEEIPNGWFRGNNKVSNKNNPMYGKTGEKHPLFGKKKTKEQIEKMSGKNNPMYGKPSPMRGKKMSEESKQKMSESAKRRMSIPENNPMYGKVRIINGVENKIIDSNSPIPDGWRRGMKRYGKVSPNKGKKMSDEQKKKISIALSGRKINESKILRGEKHWAYGKHFSEETRKKMSKSQSGRKVSSETKEKK